MRGKIKLMHKDKPVVIMQINNNNQVEEIIEVINKDLLPPSVSTEDDRDLRIELTRWLKGRVFSPGRLDIMEIQSFLSKDSLSLAGKVSLFDCYWLSSNNSETWENINPYKNWDFSKDPISLLNLKPEYFNKRSKIDSPNLAIPGKEIKLFYRNKKGDLFLLSQNVIKEMSFYKRNKDNPVVAKRKYIALAGKLFSARKMIANENIEAFPLSDLLIRTEGFGNKGLEETLHCLASFGIGRPKVMDFIKNMVLADERIGNEDREPDSIYVLRDSETLKFIGLAEI